MSIVNNANREGVGSGHVGEIGRGDVEKFGRGSRAVGIWRYLLD
jgi:hypothetical protein